MKNKIFNLLKKYKVVIISAIVVIAIGLISLGIAYSVINKITIKKVDEQYYAFNYDNTWKLKEKQKDMIILKHNSESLLTIQITELSDKFKYSPIDELLDEIIYSIKTENPQYKLISKKESEITKYKYKGYKLLYENDKEQVMMTLYKKSDKLISIKYESTNDYFDILLDSVNYIINNLDIKDETFNLKDSLKIETSEIKYNANEDLDKNYIDTKNYEIATNNYKVKFSLPSNFIEKELNSKLGLYNLTLNSGNIDITVNINKQNIYEYLNKEESINVYKYYSYYHKEDSKDYTDFEETLTKLQSDYDSYIYKNSFYYNSQTEKIKLENAELIYSLDNNHILIIKIKTYKIPITQKLINMIKIESSQNYANYFSSNIVDNYLISSFEKFKNYDNNKINYITLKLPNTYKEIDKNTNTFLEKNYSLNYNDELKIYDYNVHYGLTKSTDKNIINGINSIYIKKSYGEYHNLEYTGDFTLSNKEFKVYDGGYTDVSGIMLTNINRKRYYVHKKVLIFEMPNDGNFYIEINGNNKEITNELLIELTNFTIEEKDYKKKKEV